MMPFPKSEYADRITRVRSRMADQGFDLLISSNPANMNYLTGYDGWSFYTPQIVAIDLHAAEPLCIVRGIDRAGGAVTTYLSDENMLGYPDNYVQAVDKHPMDWIGAHLCERGFGKGRIAVDMDAYYYSANAHASLMRAMPQATFIDSGNLINWVRLIKSEAEINYMRDAATLVEITMRTGIDSIDVGVRQCDTVAAIYNAQIQGTSEFGGEYTAIVPMLPSGKGTTTPHLTWSNEPFKNGEPTILELAGCRARYHCPMSRTVYLGQPTGRVIDIAKIAIEALNAAIDTTKPGVTCEDIQAAWSTVTSRHGITKDSRMGYSIGLNYPPDWGEHTLSIRPGDRTIIQTGMTIHVMPGLWFDDWGIEISEAIVVTETGAERLCNFPQDLVIKA